MEFRDFQLQLSAKTEVLRHTQKNFPWVPWSLWRLKMALGDHLSR